MKEGQAPCMSKRAKPKDEYGSGRSRFKETGRDCIESQKWKREKEGRQLRLRERDKREREERKERLDEDRDKSKKGKNGKNKK